MTDRERRLTDFELCVMLAIARIRDAAYGVSIAMTIEARTRRSVAIGAVYVAVARLADKGYLTTSLSDPEPVRGGRAKRIVQLTEPGRRVLRRSAEGLSRMLDGLNLAAPVKGR